MSSIKIIKEKNIAEQLDQFFTKDSLAQYLFTVLNRYLIKEDIISDLWLEPSAGSGAFFKLMPVNKRLGIDIFPKISEIISCDFLEYPLTETNYITLGNPPFGKNSSLAVKFFNKCAKHSQIVAFIVPKTFKKQSIISKLDSSFHLEYSEDLPEYSFELEGESYNVPCVFQIWRRKDIQRELIKSKTKHIDFIFCTKEKANFAIQRVGANAGRIKDEFSSVANQSHYFIAASNEVKARLKNIDWNTVKYNTAGNPSIAKVELIDLYIKEKNK